MPIKSLYCSACMKRDKPFSRVQTWLNVEVVGVLENGMGAACRCKSCGHEWDSRSKAGRRAARRHASLDAKAGEGKTVAQTEQAEWLPGWFTDVGNRAGTAHLYLGLHVDGKSAIALCGREVLISDLQDESEALRRCAHCLKHK